MAPLGQTLQKPLEEIVYTNFELERSKELAEVDGEEKNPADRYVRAGMRDNTYVAARNERNEDISIKKGA